MTQIMCIPSPDSHSCCSQSEIKKGSVMVASFRKQRPLTDIYYTPIITLTTGQEPFVCPWRNARNAYQARPRQERDHNNNNRDGPVFGSCSFLNYPYAKMCHQKFAIVARSFAWKEDTTDNHKTHSTAIITVASFVSERGNVFPTPRNSGDAPRLLLLLTKESQ